MTTAGGTAFHTLDALVLTADAPEGGVGVQAVVRGSGGDVPARAIVQVDPDFAREELFLGAATLAVTNERPLSGGGVLERDVSYRPRLLGRPRNLSDAGERAARGARGRRRARRRSSPTRSAASTSSQSYFDLFDFGQRQFSADRRLGEPYFFDVVIAHEFARSWRDTRFVRGSSRARRRRSTACARRGSTRT